MAVLDLGESALVSWTPFSLTASRYDVFGLAAGEASYLGSVDAPNASFLAPGDFEGYGVVAIVDGEAHRVGEVCLEIERDPPDVGINFYCGGAAKRVLATNALP